MGTRYASRCLGPRASVIGLLLLLGSAACEVHPCPDGGQEAAEFEVKGKVNAEDYEYLLNVWAIDWEIGTDELEDRDVDEDCPAICWAATHRDYVFPLGTTRVQGELLEVDSCSASQLFEDGSEGPEFAGVRFECTGSGGGQYCE